MNTYAAIFAADVEPAIYQNRMATTDFLDLASEVGHAAEVRRRAAEAEGRDFYPQAFAEVAAQRFNATQGEASLDELLAAGQRECDSLAA